MFLTARHRLGLRTGETIMIGDTMETDILGGVSMGYRTVLVLSGGTERHDLARYAYRPDYVMESIAPLSRLTDLRQLLDATEESAIPAAIAS
jgi:5'-nucleotidase